MPTEVTPHVTPSLHPDNLAQLDGYDDPVARAYIGQAETALSSAYLSISAIHTARETAKKNTALTPEAILMRTADYAEKQRDKVLKGLDSATAALGKSIQGTEQILTAPLEQQSGAGSINSEIRAHLKGLDREDRVKLIRELNEKNDDKSLTAILGAPAYLSGFSDVEHGLYLRQYRERKHPAEAKRLRLMQSAHALLVERSPLVFAETDRAVFGTDENSTGNWRKVQQLREMHKATEKAFAL